MADTGFVQKFDTTVSSWLSYVDQNEYVTAALSLFLILYAAYAAPKLPPYILMMFDKPLFKLLIFFLIVYTARKNPTVAIIAAVGFMVTIQALTSFKVNQVAMEVVQKQKREAMTPLSEVDPSLSAHQTEMHMEDLVHRETTVPRGSIVGILDEVKSKPVSESEPESVDSCVKKSQYRNSFYPQYVNMKPDAYEARYTGNDVNGFDPEAGYSSL